jgi:AP-2 complex subunit alpha
MAHLAACSSSLLPVKKHQDTIILSLKDRDISVRRRALDLLYSMCDTTNAKTIVGELVRYLQVADYNLREEMVLKIAILTERFATEVSCRIRVRRVADGSTSGMSIRYCSSSRRRVIMSGRKCGTG